MKLPAVERRSLSSPRARRQRTRRSGSFPMPLPQLHRMGRRRRRGRTGRSSATEFVVFTDHDDEGEKFGDRVRSLALAAGATQVRIVRSEDVARLMDRHHPLPEKWDLADAEQEGLDATRAAALLEFAPIDGGDGDVREPSQNGVDRAQLAGLPHSAKGLADRFTARFQHRAAWVVARGACSMASVGLRRPKPRPACSPPRRSSC